ncbi:ABC transporter permease [Serpentinicella alkaliphila]|uniref:Putative ABC transport system permease protein n=1 Tax=Serpentinicella alkaliphila TaxID=1734049 RepID=A0A4R2T4L6_9FIRM|nr:ABC transporter permease [Serpentinicella alkaliphila]TCP96965.1 putative ABC transport system permease protein [Serpentinicella alkaliphila]
MTGKNRIKIALKNLREYKLRSFLTLMSIAVGIATLVSLIIISQSMERAVGERLGGTVDVIRVLPGHVVPGRDFVPYGSFTEESANEVEKIRGVEATSTWMVEIAIAEYEGKSAPVEVMGGNPSDIREFLGGSVELKEGRLIKEGANPEAILSTSTLEHINRWLNADLKVNDVLNINGVEVTIVGVMAYDLAGVEVSHRLLMNKEIVKEITDSENVMLMLAKVNDLNRVYEIKEEIEDILDQVHGVSGLTTAVAAQSVVDQVGMVTLIIQAVVISIALIALIVGCLGIINVMLMSVMERTREIGIMKAIGAKNKDILALFLVEASTISLIGGILGVLSGVAISFIANSVISRFIIVNMSLIISPKVLFGGIVVAVVTGIIGGLYPARRAAKMRPVEALRHE